MEKNDIYVRYGKDSRQIALDLLRKAQLNKLIGSTDKKIGIKPNLVLASPASNGATTHPELVDAVLFYLKEHGFHNISIIEGAWVGDVTSKAFTVCGYRELAEKYDVPLIDTQKDSHQTHHCAGLDIDLCDSARNVDFMINMPVLKGHCQTLLTCALKNNKGVIPNTEKRRFHRLGLDKPIAHLNLAAPTDFILVDGICGDLDFEEGGNPVETNRVIAARDPVLCDAYAATLLGYRPDDVAYIPLAEALGVGSANLQNANIIETNSGKNTPRQQGESPRKVAVYRRYIDERSACSACYASLVRSLTHFSHHELAALQKSPIAIGQAFKGQSGGFGVGVCTAGFDESVIGCPPAPLAITRALNVKLR